MTFKNIILFVFSSLYLLIAGCAGSKYKQQKVTNAGMDIYLLIGQSNMAGFGTVEALDTPALKNVYLFNDSNQWEIAKNTKPEGFNRYSSVKNKTNKLSPAYTFVRKIAAYSGKTIGIVSNARGATTADQWQKGYSGKNDFNLYEETLVRALAALAAKPEAKVRAIIWHQGEGDSSKEKSEVYLDKLNKLVEDLRTDLQDENIAVIAGEVGTWRGRGININPKIREINKYISNAAWVNSNGLTSINEAKNDPHFDTQSVRILGGRYADKAAELVYKLKLTGAIIFSLPNYQGRSVLLVPGNYSAEDIESNGIKITEIQSAVINNGHKLILKTQTGSEVLAGNTADIKTKISSITVK